MLQNKNTLKGWFQRGMKPLASQFADWMDSYWHKNENIPSSAIDGLQGLLDAKANRDEIPETTTKVNLCYDRCYDLPIYDRSTPYSYAKICDVNTSCVMEVTYTVNGYYSSDRITISKGRCMFAYCLFNDQNRFVTDITSLYVKLDGRYPGTLSVRLSYCEDPGQLTWMDDATACIPSAGTRNIIPAINKTAPSFDDTSATVLTVGSSDVSAGYKVIDLIAHKDFILQFEDEVDGSFYYDATATEGEYYEDKIYRFSFDRTINNFRLRIAGTEVAFYEGTIYRNDILTLTPPAAVGDTWLVNLDRTKTISSDGSLNVDKTEDGQVDLSINLTFDDVPTANSTNPVTSSGVKAYVDSRLTSVYRLIGTVQFASIPTSGVSIGDVYNISDAFITTPDFAEGAGIHCPAGTNIAYDNNNKWDLLGGAFNIEYATNSDIDAMFV